MGEGAPKAREPSACSPLPCQAAWQSPTELGFSCLAPHFLPAHSRQEDRHLVQEVPALLQGGAGAQEPAVAQQPLLHLPFLWVIWKHPGCGTNFLK